MKVWAPTNSPLHHLLQNHPRVTCVEGHGESGLAFGHNGNIRKVQVGDDNLDLFGLPESIDNNPLVCAMAASVPDPAATLGLIALSPLLRAGLVLEPPIVQTNAHGECLSLWCQLQFNTEIHVEFEHCDENGVLACTAFAEIVNLEDWNQIDKLYDDCYGGAFFVHELSPNLPWSGEHVRNTPQSYYRLRLTPGDDRSLLAIQVMADQNGKCGATQLIHVMNIMAGFEESLGIPDKLSAV